MARNKPLTGAPNDSLATAVGPSIVPMMIGVTIVIIPGLKKYFMLALVVMYIYTCHSQALAYYEVLIELPSYLFNKSICRATNTRDQPACYEEQ